MNRPEYTVRFRIGNDKDGKEESEKRNSRGGEMHCKQY